MEIRESVTKYILFSMEDKRLINQAILHQHGNVTFKSFLNYKNPRYCDDYMIPLMSAYGKVVGILQSSSRFSYDAVIFSPGEENAICNTLEKECKDETLDQEYRDKIQAILETIKRA